MDVCVFCGQSVAPVAEGRDLIWLDDAGQQACTADGGTGPHYPGREADLFWRGSEMVDLTSTDPAVDLTRSYRIDAGR
jgi:hypothetical protein